MYRKHPLSARMQLHLRLLSDLLMPRNDTVYYDCWNRSSLSEDGYHCHMHRKRVSVWHQ